MKELLKPLEEACKSSTKQHQYELATLYKMVDATVDQLDRIRQSTSDIEILDKIKVTLKIIQEGMKDHVRRTYSEPSVDGGTDTLSESSIREAIRRFNG